MSYPKLCRHMLLGAAAGSLLTLSANAAQFSTAPVQLSFNGFPAGFALGWSVSLSPSGRVALLGGPGSGNSLPGTAFLYTQSGGSWSEPIPLSLAGIANGSQAGWAVAVAPDDSQAFVSAPDINTYTGAVYAYTPVNGNWTNATRSMLPTTGVPQKSSLGSAIALSSNGQVLVVGASHAADSSNPGQVYVYTLVSGNWGNPVALPVPAALAGIKAGLGASVAVSADGTVIVAGAPNGNSATAYVYTRTGNTWGTAVALTIPNGASSNGYSVAISADGREILTGAPFTGGGMGAAYLYNLSNGSWSVTHTFTTTSSSTLGWSVGLSPDGQKAFMGSPGGQTGTLYASINSNGSWSTPAALSTSNVQYGAALGWSIAVGQNGQMLLSGAIGANSNAGDGYIYNSSADITLAIAPSSNPVAPSSDVTFNLTFTNADQPGTFPATTLTNVVLTDTLPAGVSYVSSNAANGTCANSGNTVTCMLAILAPGNNSQNPWSPSIMVKTPSSTGTLTNTLSASADQPLQGTTNTSTTLTISSSGSSGSSGKSGGGGTGLPTLIVFVALVGFLHKRKHFKVQP